MKQLGVLLLPLDGLLVHHRVPSMKQLGVLLLPLDGLLVHHRIPRMKQLGVLLLPLDGLLVHHRIPRMKQLGVLLLPLDGLLVHHRIPSMKQLEKTRATKKLTNFFANFFHHPFTLSPPIFAPGSPRMTQFSHLQTKQHPQEVQISFIKNNVAVILLRLV